MSASPQAAASAGAPPGAEARRRERAYLGAIAEHGVPELLENGRGLVLRVWTVDGAPVPILVSDGRPGKAAFASPRAHYLDYPVHEIARRSRFWTRRRLGLALLPLRAALAWGRIDRVVYLHHWLLVGGPPPAFARASLRRLVERAAREHPDHAVVLPGVVPALDPGLARDAGDCGGRLVQKRIVYVVDPRRPLRGRRSKGARRNRRVDRDLLRSADARRLEGPALGPHAGGMRELYARLYLDRHAGDLNARYTTAFFRLALASGLFQAVGWTQGEALEAFQLHLVSGGVLDASVCGYDTEAPLARGLYRMLAAEDLDTAERAGVVTNWGAGSDRFKRLRGGEPCFEFDAVFDRHLPLRRRLPWWLLRRARAAKHRIPADGGPGGRARGEARPRERPEPYSAFAGSARARRTCS